MISKLIVNTWNRALWIAFRTFFRMMAQMSAASSKFSSPNYCDAIPGLSRLQRKLCSENPSATRVLHRGLRDAVDECRHQFATERWNCSVADGAFGLALKGRCMLRCVFPVIVLNINNANFQGLFFV